MTEEYDDEGYEKNKEKENFLIEFLEIIKKRLFLKKTLMLDFSNFEVFDSLKIEADKYMTSIQEIETTSEKFDFIIGNLPLGLPSEEFIDSAKEMKIRIKKNWIYLLKSLFLLENNRHGNCYGLYLVEPNFLMDKKFKELLKEKGFFINAVFRTPENFLDETNLRPLLVLISKKETKKLFICEFKLNVKKYPGSTVIETIDFESVLGKFISRYSNKKEFLSMLELGVWVDSSFENFEKYKISKKLDQLSEQFKEYKKYKLSELSMEINLSKEFEEKSNSIYIPNIRNSSTIHNLKFAKLKHQNYFQVVLDSKLVMAEYLASFFASEIGKETLKMLTSGSVIPHVNKTNLEECIIPLPGIRTQEKMVSTFKNLGLLKEKMSEFEDELSLNPKSSDKIQESLNRLLDSLEMLNEEDKILALIREGESKTLEFKETLLKNIYTNQKDEEMKLTVLKNIVAFLNTEGGILLIGISDDGQIKGIENDFYKSNDDYLLLLHNLIRDHLGINLDRLISPKIIEILGKKILIIKCEKSNKEVFTKNKEFYYRGTPATEKLEGPELLDYINNHFKK